VAYRRIGKNVFSLAFNLSLTALLSLLHTQILAMTKMTKYQWLLRFRQFRRNNKPLPK
jgi:hypothetical protein